MIKIVRKGDNMSLRKKILIILSIFFGIILYFYVFIIVSENIMSPKATEEFTCGDNKYRITKNEYSLFDKGTCRFIDSTSDEIRIPVEVSSADYGIFPDTFKVTSADITNLKDKSVYIPETIESVYYMKNQFVSEKVEVEYIEVSDEHKIYDSRDNCGCLIETKTNKLLLSSKNSFFPNDIKIVSSYSSKYYFKTFNHSFTIPSSVEKLEDYAFYTVTDSNYYSYYVEYLDLNNVKEIGHDCFTHNIKFSNDSSIVIPKKCLMKYDSFPKVMLYENLKINVYYKGSKSDWFYNVGLDISRFGSGYIFYYYSEESPIDEENLYWHYDENNQIVKW